MNEKVGIYMQSSYESKQHCMRMISEAMEFAINSRIEYVNAVIASNGGQDVLSDICDKKVTRFLECLTHFKELGLITENEETVIFNLYLARIAAIDEKLRRLKNYES